MTWPLHPKYLPKRNKAYVHAKTYIPMFTGALLVKNKTWKQPKCPLIGKLMNDLWYIHTMYYY